MLALPVSALPVSGTMGIISAARTAGSTPYFGREDTQKCRKCKKVVKVVKVLKVFKVVKDLIPPSTEKPRFRRAFA